MSYPNLLNPQPVSLSSEDEREGSFFEATVTLYEKQTTRFREVPEMKGVEARRYPYSFGSEVQDFQENRKYTDQIKLRGYYPRAHSGLYARVTEKNPKTGQYESVMYIVRDVEHDGDRSYTTLLAGRRGLDDA